MRNLWALVLAATLSLPAFADEAQIRKVLEPKLGGAKIEGVERGPLGLYEVRYRSEDGVRILYTDATATHIVVGKIYDSKGDKDLTEARLRKFNAINFESLPLAQAVKVQRGNGKRVLVMFSDPYCPYCKRFEETLQQFDNITVYVFMFPVIRPISADHSRLSGARPTSRRPGSISPCAASRLRGAFPAKTRSRRTSSSATSSASTARRRSTSPTASASPARCRPRT
jgi:protein-disulfide isomerase